MSFKVRHLTPSRTCLQDDRWWVLHLGIGGGQVRGVWREGLGEWDEDTRCTHVSQGAVACW